MRKSQGRCPQGVNAELRLKGKSLSHEQRGEKLRGNNPVNRYFSLSPERHCAGVGWRGTEAGEITGAQQPEERVVGDEKPTLEGHCMSC